jgi:RNA recognition motif-containing protein
MASKLFVGGLPYAVTSAELKAHFAQCGTVVSVTIVVDHVAGQPRSFGFVEMSNEAEAQAAIAQLNRQTFHGRWLNVRIADQSAPERRGPRGAA